MLVLVKFILMGEEQTVRVGRRWTLAEAVAVGLGVGFALDGYAVTLTRPPRDFEFRTKAGAYLDPARTVDSLDLSEPVYASLPIGWGG
jgi:hypothetical protein